MSRNFQKLQAIPFIFRAKTDCFFDCSLRKQSFQDFFPRSYNKIFLPFSNHSVQKMINGLFRFPQSESTLQQWAGPWSQSEAWDGWGKVNIHPNKNRDCITERGMEAQHTH